MKDFRFWIPAIVGVLVTLLSRYLVSLGTGPAGHAGAGMGIMLIFYPLPSLVMMLLTGGASGDAFLLHVVSVLVIGVVAVQFPLYGFIISYARLKRSFWLKLCASVVWLHIGAIIICLIVTVTLGWF